MCEDFEKGFQEWFDVAYGCDTERSRNGSACSIQRSGTITRPAPSAFLRILQLPSAASSQVRPGYPSARPSNRIISRIPVISAKLVLTITPSPPFSTSMYIAHSSPPFFFVPARLFPRAFSTMPGITSVRVLRTCMSTNAQCRQMNDSLPSAALPTILYNRQNRLNSLLLSYRICVETPFLPARHNQLCVYLEGRDRLTAKIHPICMGGRRGRYRMLSLRIWRRCRCRLKIELSSS